MERKKFYNSIVKRFQSIAILCQYGNTKNQSLVYLAKIQTQDSSKECNCQKYNLEENVF